jgi:hypothetical protein
MRYRITPLIFLLFSILISSFGNPSENLSAQEAQKIHPQEKPSETIKPDSSDVRAVPPKKSEDGAPPVSPEKSSAKPESKAQKKGVVIDKKASGGKGAIPTENNMKNFLPNGSPKNDIDAKNFLEIIIISPSQPDDKIAYDGWHGCKSFREIKNWARIFGLKAMRNRFATTSDTACFVSKHGSNIRIISLDPSRRYHLWINFVTYAKLSDEDINAYLEVFADKEKLARFTFQEAAENPDPIRLEIPYHLTIDGKLTLELREYSIKGGFFGIWNMALSDSIELPQAFAPQPKIEKLIEPDSIIDQTSRPHEKTTPARPAGSDSPIVDTASPSSKKKTSVETKTSAKDIRARISASEKKAPAGTDIKKRTGKIGPDQRNKKLEKQKEIEARKMLKEDQKKDIREQ